VNVVLWVLAGILAAAFLFAGLGKVTQPREKLVAQKNMAWTEDFSEGPIKLIGVAEILAAVALIVPPLVGVATWLTPLAALGLVALMIGAAITHLRRGETQNVVVNLVILVLAAIVAWGRFGPYAF
jgi:uncharacterized membrane protein YphA (DoxX/SURF4 family)